MLLIYVRDGHWNITLVIDTLVIGRVATAPIIVIFFVLKQYSKLVIICLTSINSD